MALLGMGIFYGGIIVGVPTVTGVAEGVSHQKKANEEAADNTRMIKFYLDVFCEAKTPKAKEIAGGMIVLKHEKVGSFCLLAVETSMLMVLIATAGLDRT
jgi:hypothetical protein